LECGWSIYVPGGTAVADVVGVAAFATGSAASFYLAPEGEHLAHKDQVGPRPRGWFDTYERSWPLGSRADSSSRPSEDTIVGSNPAGEYVLGQEQYFFQLRKNSNLLQRWRCSCKFRFSWIGPWSSEQHAYYSVIIVVVNAAIVGLDPPGWRRWRWRSLERCCSCTTG
jgi:hypothetical protein